MKKICAGILAHVDAGKTTLSESFLYAAGSIRKLGRVDNRDTFLDTDTRERERGITIFSKQARLTWNELEITLLDTPGHVDFSAEMERALSVLDYAVLIVSAADGVQSHTKTLWNLFARYRIPVFVFVNKMDQPGMEREKALENIREKLGNICVDFTDFGSEEFYEEAASCSEEAMECFFETGKLSDEMISSMIFERALVPCFFGSALKQQGVIELLDAMEKFCIEKSYPESFGARVYKITRDESGSRLTHIKVTGGSLSARETISGVSPDKTIEDNGKWSEKVNQIRLYSGDKFTAVNEVHAGDVCTITGLSYTYPGEGLGIEEEEIQSILEPILKRRVILPDTIDAPKLFPMLKQLEEELPEINVIWDETLRELTASVMGDVQIEILKNIVLERFGVEIDFGPANVIYKETIANVVEGVGHFEPLRHYAEVHLLMEPLPAGSGLKFKAECSEDELDKNWQRLIMTHLTERVHRGVLTGSAITDMRITIVAGRAHKKHTEGGDFRQATYRAVRQGLMEAESVLLEPFYNFRLELPDSCIGRAMTDIEKMNGHFDPPYVDGTMTVLTGYAPVVTMQDYKKELMIYTRGAGTISFSLRGFEECHNPDEVIAKRGYDPTADLRNTPDSVFCSHGAGVIVPWNEVKEFMHVESIFSDRRGSDSADEVVVRNTSSEDKWIGTDEVDAIIESTYNANSKSKPRQKNGVVRRKTAETVPSVSRTYKKPEPKREEYLLVDGYNIIHAWPELRELAMVNLDSARGVLLDELCNYQGYRKMNLIAVFDAYKVKGHRTEAVDYNNIHVVYTKEAETADQYIEKFAHTHSDKYNVTVATSDGLEQIIIRGEGCRLLSARDFKIEVDSTKEAIRSLISQ